MIRRKIGLYLLSVGARLALSDAVARNAFKDTVNRETVTAAQQQGGHCLGDIRPMCDFDTWSVIAVLKQGSPRMSLRTISNRLSEYREEWTV